jgi:hypothetical protein
LPNEGTWRNVTNNNSASNSDITGKVDKIEDKALLKRNQYGDFLGMYKDISESTGNVVNMLLKSWNLNFYGG